MKKLLFVIALSSVLIVWSTGETGSFQKDEIPIMVVVFHHHFGGGQKLSEAILPIYLGVEGKDAPAAVLAAFKQRYPNIIFYPFSKSKLDAAKAVIDYKSGGPAQNIEFSSVRRRKETEAEVEIGWYCKQKFSGADVYKLRKYGDGWRIVCRKQIFRM